MWTCRGLCCHIKPELCGLRKGHGGDERLRGVAEILENAFIYDVLAMG